jgi:acyl transferase domain-containing protein/acyl-CoA synthetase (AMP-forming)/AMP-acid ligase II/acyl carrier protein
VGIVKTVLGSSIPAVLRERASLRPDETAFTYVDYEQDWAGVAESLTWSQLYRRTLNVAQELKACGSTGDRAVILAPQGLEYIVAFLGALQAGQIAVPLSAPQGGASDERVSAVLHDASPTAVLTTSAIAGTIAEYIKSKPSERAPSLIEVDLLDLDSEKTSAAEDDSPPSIAHLQYTSGSTRTPAGVVVSHRNIQVGCEQIMSAYYEQGVAPPDTTVVSWLPLFHDMGLIFGIAFPILQGFRIVLTSPPSFLQRPARWMQLLASTSHAFSAAPNIAFELATRKTSDDDLAGLDLGGVRNILNGAERVNPPTLRRFAERFARFNLRPEVLRASYGIAEATLYVATRESGQPPKTVFFESEKLTAGHAKRSASGDGIPLVSYGMPQSPTVRIVDPETSIECPAGTVGEIWVHGDNVADGYWQKPQETEHTFGATLVGPSAGTPEGPWLRTGDLGFFSDGEMFIVGRIKDLLIVYGRNYAPDDIEATIQEITRNRCVAIAVPDDDGAEKLVTIVELKPGGDSEEGARRLGVVRREITAAISRTHGLGVADLVLVPPHSIPLTTSGKVRRRDCLQRYLRNEFTRLDALIRRPERRTVDETGSGARADSGWAQRLRTLRKQQHDLLVGVVCSQAATVLGRPSPDDIDPGSPFQDLGFDSVKATELLDRLKTETELALPPTLAFDYPTPNELATHLGQLLSGSVAAAPGVASRVGSDEPVAVVGMACRFPGGVDSAAALWDLVVSGTDAVGDFPGDRGWDLGGLFDPDPDAVGKTYTRCGAFLPDVAGFDAEFFGISGREARAMDPQQRLLLEVCWEALEHAGIDPAGLVGSDSGVFVGAWAQLYGAGGSDGLEGYAMTGSATSVASGRVAYVLGLQGPAITVDTACSSSLVATHLAGQSLRNGECGLALAGGVTVMTTPAAFIEFARQRGLAVDGRCKAFSAAADGTGWGEGAAVLVLERLSDARANNHRVLAVIAGSAINQDGASNGLTAPNGPAQQRVIRQAAANAGITLDQVDVVEAHGTGTTLGDPIESGALIATYGASRDREHPLWLGSVKSNIGHTQAAAGAAGLIKMIEALNHDILPPTLHVDHPSPHIDWSDGALRLLTEAVPWPLNEHPRTAAVSSFGISGTNAHVIVQQATVVAPAQPVPEPTAEPFPSSPLLVWPVSARSPKALAAQANQLHQHLTEHPDVGLTDVAYSLAATRTHHPYRAAITAHPGTGDPRQELLDGLHALTADLPHPRLTRHHLGAHPPSKTVFVLPGQGAQYPGMGLDLYRNHRSFARTLDNICEALDAHLEVSLSEIMFAEPGSAVGELIHQTSYAQPALFAMGAAMHALFVEAGITPDYLLGHSIGELTAAYIAGVFSLADAAVLVTARGRLMQACPPGAMIAIQANERDVEALLKDHPTIAIAAVNGPTSVVVSGHPDELEPIRDYCAAHNLRSSSLSVSHAFHSSLMDPALPEFEAIAAGLTLASPAVPILSNLTGQIANSEQLASSRYWTRHLREPVRFYDSVAGLLGQGEHVFLELSPHPVMAAAITDTLAGAVERAQSVVITTLHRDRPDLDAVATALARLHNHGHSPSWRALYPDARTVALPTYAFQHRSYWAAPTPTAEVSGVADGALWKAVDDDAVDTVAQVLGLSDAQSGTSLGAVVRALRQWRSDLGVRSAVNKLRYRAGWQPVTPNTFPPTRRRWLVLAFPEQSDDVWITGLSAKYAEAVEVLTVDPSELGRNSLSALLTTAATRAQCDGIVSFMATDERAHPDFSGISVGLFSVLLVAQAHCDSGLGIPLWVVTQGAVSVSTDDGPASPSQSAAWGLGQSVCLEHPDQWGGLVDLPPSATPHDIEHLYSILTCPQSEDQLAIRRHGVSARRLVKAPLPLERLERAHTWKPSGTALVTGATGRLAKHVVGWLAEAGADHLVLLSRSAAEHPQSAELEKELQTRGVGATSVSVDVTDRSALAPVLANIRSAHGPIRTVVHIAAAIEWNTISDTTAEEFSSSYAAKAVGANNLVELLEDEPPDTFILFSSAAATWGGAQQGAYAAANAHIDALAARMRSNGRTALSAAFGLWADQTGGLPHEILDYFQRIGINEIPPTTALAALQQAIEANDTLITIADVSWDRFLPLFTARRSHPLLTEFASPANTTETSSSTSTPSASALREMLAGQTAEEKLHTLTTMVASAAATVFAHPDPAALDPDRPFKDLGIDSLTALELRNSLTTHTGLTLPATVAFDHPTPIALATHLADLLTDTAAPAVPAAQASTRGDEPVDNRLAYTDQAGFFAERAVHGALIQVTWIYNRAVDVEGLRRFQRNLGCGLLGRRIERSPLPFARDHWVLSPASEDIDIAATPRRRADVSAWSDERARLPIDPEWGPGWHLGVLPLEDGGTAVSLVVSHTIVDAIGLSLAIADAAEGRTHNLGYPSAGSRTRRLALREDLRQTVKELPNIGHALAAVARRARRDSKELRSSIKGAPASPRTESNDEAVEVPVLTACVDVAEWDARAKSLGGNSNSLVAGFGSRLAARVGRVRDDGTVTLRLPVSLRTNDDDTRGNALTSVDVTVDPTNAATALGEMHVKITQAILEAMENSDEFLAPLALATFIPKWVARRMAAMAAGGDILPVTCSNAGDLPPAAIRPDGTDADYTYMRPVEPDITKSTLESIGGRLLVVSWRSRGKIFIVISAYLLGRPNTNSELREVISRTLAEFDLIAQITC